MSDKHGVKMVRFVFPDLRFLNRILFIFLHYCQVVQDNPSQEGDKPLRIVGDPMKCEHAKEEVMEILSSAVSI